LRALRTKIFVRRVKGQNINMSKALATKNVAAIVLAFAMIVGFAFAFATPAKADTLSTLQAQVQALLAQISALQGGGSATMSSGAGCYTFTQSLKKGSTGGEVMWVQKFLNNHGAMVTASGAGSPGNETSTFGPATAAAVKKFQEANAADILTPVGLTAGTGNWGPSTRAKANALCAGSMMGGGTTGGMTGGTTGGTVVPSGPGISVSAGVQPANSLAPKNALRVPFTTFTLTNNSGAAVMVTGVNVMRTGLAQDSDFSSIVLVDSNGLQVGNTQTFNSDHTAVVGGSFTLNAGQSMTYTVSGNIANAPGAGDVASLAVTGVQTSAPVSGSLPITGASQTMNSTLTIGTISTAMSAFDPNNATNKQIGSTGIKFTGVRFTADSAEDVKFYSLRWRVNGSASAADLANVVTVVNGTTYPAVVSADGRYYTSTFPGGLLVTKGNSVDAYVQGDLAGSNSAGRVVEFDVDKVADVYFVGQTYGFGNKVTLGGTCTTLLTGAHATCFSSSGAALQPWFQGSTVTVQAGTVTTIQNATAVASQNIPNNVSNTVLGGFTTNFAGEPVTVSGMTFTGTFSGGSSDYPTSVSLVDQNGTVVAGPADVSGGTLTFSNSVTFPVGARTYTLKGKVPSTSSTGDTIVFATTPSSWTSPTGQTSGNTVSISIGSFNMNTMTVRAGALAITAAATPASQTIVAPSSNVVLANIQLDASQSGEDMRVSSVKLRDTGNAGIGQLNSCQLWDGTTALNTGSNVLNNLATTTVPQTVTMDNSLTISKGTVKTLAFSCNVGSAISAGSTIIWGVNSADTITATGLQSGSSITVTPTTGQSGTMTVSSGASVVVSVDASSPSYAIQSGGATGVTLGVFKVRSSNESFNLTKIGLFLTSGSASDLGTVTLYNGATAIGTATFTGSNTSATSTLTSALLIPRDTDVLITAKGDIASIGTGMPGNEGDNVKVDPSSTWEGTGVSSGSTKDVVGTVGVSGVRIFRSFPASIALDSSGTLAGGTVMRFKITADSHGPIGIYGIKFTGGTYNNVTVTNVSLYGYTDSGFSNPIPGVGSAGLINTNPMAATLTAGVAYIASSTAAASGVFQIPAGTTYYFDLHGTASVSNATFNGATTLNGDTTFSGMLAATSVSGNFVWSPNATTTTAVSVTDWTNGAGISGLPASGLSQNRTQ
jgi:hypothetical protein